MNRRSLKPFLLTCGAIALFSSAACAGRSDVQDGPSMPRHWSPPSISGPGYEASPAFTPDGREMYFIGADPDFRNYRLMLSRCEGDGWSKPEPAPFAVPLPVIEADPFITADGRRLYYISSRHSPKDEDFDIWYVDRTGDGTWGSPQRLPEPVNSKGAELLPRVDANGHLIFGSDRPGGLGLGDIYVATQQPDGRWTVRNVGAPVNTASHEYEAELSRSGKTLIVVADREGKSHLYRYVLRDGGWQAAGRVPARDDTFQVGPLLSPTGDRLIFAQKEEGRSGEMYLTDLTAKPDMSWPPECPRRGESAGSRK